MSNTTNTLPEGIAHTSSQTSTPLEENATPLQVPQKKETARLTRQPNHARTRTYTHDVYKRRFKEFRHIRLLSALVGGSILLVLILGMWQLYTKVFSTIENTEHLFLITEKRRTHVIQFNILEEVRASWNNKYNTPTPPPTAPLFPVPEPEESEQTNE